MGEKSRKRRSHSHSEDSFSETQSSSSSSLSDSDDSQQPRSSSRRRHRHRHHAERTSSRSKREKERKRKRKKERDAEGSSRRKSRKDERRSSKKRRSSSRHSDHEIPSEPDMARDTAESVLRDMLAEFPGVVNDLKQLLQMIDSGQAVDIKGITERSLAKHLKKLFRALSLEENGGVFLLPSNSSPVLEVVGPLLDAPTESKQQMGKDSDSVRDSYSGEPFNEARPNTAVDVPAVTVCPPVADAEASARRRIIGPAMPSAELLVAAAKLTEAQEDLRKAELESDEFFIGPAPPAIIAETESANEAERFEEVTRIMGADENDPYDVVGANHNMPADKIKKRYWKLSLLVHPDKCSHPEAQRAFVRLNKAFKELQDPEKRKAFDDKIKLKEEQEAFKAELRAMKEAAQWRKLQGISMEGDEELLAEVEVNVVPKRDEWMTTLPPEKKPGGMPTHSTAFSRTSKEGRGDTSAWTDTPSDRAQKAQKIYLEAYNEAKALASNEEEKVRMSADAEMVDMYNKAKRSKTLVQKHQEESENRGKKKKSKQKAQGEEAKEEKEEDWVGKHPWKPWDREKDLTAGRQKVNLDPESMSAGLSSRFSSGHFQRNFL